MNKRVVINSIALIILLTTIIFIFTNTKELSCKDNLDCFIQAAETCKKATFESTHTGEKTVSGIDSLRYDYRYEWVDQQGECFFKATILETYPIGSFEKSTISDPVLQHLDEETVRKVKEIRSERDTQLKGIDITCKREDLQSLGDLKSILNSSEEQPFGYLAIISMLSPTQICTEDFIQIINDYSRKELIAIMGTENIVEGFENLAEKSAQQYKKETIQECLELEKEINICIAHVAKTNADPKICEENKYYFTEEYAPYPHTGNIDLCYVEATMNKQTFTGCEEFTKPERKSTCELQLTLQGLAS